MAEDSNNPQFDNAYHGQVEPEVDSIIQIVKDTKAKVVTSDKPRNLDP